ncbi:hypothetical protein E2562_000390 [Oryza meyeriana var. granulata]|uniref:Uncharacterized protein n=1 Tax=Oryza meyeriana var. granulata TaxID=110450 RepID=A0A6G1CBY6_9ORYZ|nr:hypothetical protein E2562_000390 [Oryza meyeriana var. granulata]
MAVAAGGAEKKQHEEAASASTSTFERLHRELVREAGELVASCGADVTVLVVSPRSGGPRVTRFGGGVGSDEVLERAVARPEEVARMGPDEVVALEERLRTLRLLVLRRIKEEEEKAKTAAMAADQPPAKP